MSRRALLLDRDGVINFDTNYVGTLDRFEFIPGIFDFLRAVQDRGYRLAVVTNQSGAVRGKFTFADYEEVTQHMVSTFAREGIVIEFVLASFNHPKADDPLYKRDSFWTKPNPGMVLESARRMSLDLKNVAMLGDNQRDMEAAVAAGVGTCLWLTTDLSAKMDGVKVVANFDQALGYL
jgi:D-glycero-D-manno-heptose 1,7-bisphosphate phosphatase